MKITPDTFIISDTHFGDKLAIKKYPIRALTLTNSHYKNFDDLSVGHWNEVVKPNDEILHLGDLFFGNSDILNKLNGHKMLILGNNDIGRCENLEQWEIIRKIKFQLEEKDEFKKAMKKKWGAELKNPYVTGLITEVSNIRIMFSHFPVGERKKNDKYYKARDIIDYAFNLAKCEINIHGHIHVRSSIQEFCCNASTEQQNFRPKKLREILYDWANY
ncbi:hypothetical protein CQA53_08330 [Helicobacter didelphidarum]|uniref:Calcineurin-like phosphoesterase domain-containing protein n=1 Tax=Helicobacter didelphidarum TaxID=2040648 RepID=A0A3D8IEZ4_9HELI|nr:metallophosphoesterase family protein [Helicobacter didelphidarum]RDU63565.1 hypothetical protein CQA53_08330 [Helicobacter didelphidarum]